MTARGQSKGQLPLPEPMAPICGFRLFSPQGPTLKQLLSKNYPSGSAVLCPVYDGPAGFVKPEILFFRPFVSFVRCDRTMTERQCILLSDRSGHADGGFVLLSIVGDDGNRPAKSLNGNRPVKSCQSSPTIIEMTVGTGRIAIRPYVQIRNSIKTKSPCDSEPALLTFRTPGNIMGSPVRR